ncbi:hypothetical protein O6H91_18G048500 [Diphasiastrum complanatum]|uniref:Uncharacterized protein n=1 Tax=Diphasiastrum complanatum TaxID=34168 RepID=A0ACC2B207_DIPCM|nr:hypothetical protein O6H91_18G048500 [Diphasiastrum complanatum]
MEMAFAAQAIPALFPRSSSSAILHLHPKPTFNSSLLTLPYRSASLLVRASSQQRERLQSLSGVVTDESVPEGHKGLHGFLYGDGEGDVHGAAGLGLGFAGRAGEDDGSSIMGWDEYVLPRETTKFAGVYAVYHETGMLQYVGYSRNVILSLKAHRSRIGKRKCSSVRVRVFSEAAMISRARLEEEQQRWLEASAVVPPGNSVESSMWEGNGDGASVVKVMSDKERSEYEEKKLKMRKAMGENLADDVEGEDDDARTRRIKLMKAMESDDWSSVIDGQSKETLGNKETPGMGETLDIVPEKIRLDPEVIVANQDQEQAINLEKIKSEKVPSSQVISPFEKPASQQNGGLYSAQIFEFTRENVDLVLNEVRPYLISDGGNVEVVSATDGVVSLRLQGACGTCPSSTSTMKMGIERVLKEKFGEVLKEVIQIDPQMLQATVAGINAHLDMLRPAIRNYGGMVEAVSVDIGIGQCEVKFNGPAPLGTGIQAAIKEKFPDIQNVVLLDSQ